MSRIDTFIENLEVGQTFDGYEVVAVEATRVALRDESAQGRVLGNRNRTASHRWYTRTSGILRLKVARALEQG